MRRNIHCEKKKQCKIPIRRNIHMLGVIQFENKNSN